MADREENGPHPSVHPTADVEPGARLGEGVRVWRHTHVRATAEIGPGCVLGADVYVGSGVRLGRNCKVQNQALLYEGVTLEDGVFVGPQVCFTNDLLPRAVNPDLSLKQPRDWQVGRTLVRAGASVSAGSVVITGVTIGRWALVGAGAVVTRDVPDHALVLGAPARIQGWVCRCAGSLTLSAAEGGAVDGECGRCGLVVRLPSDASAWRGGG